LASTKLWLEDAAVDLHRERAGVAGFETPRTACMRVAGIMAVPAFFLGRFGEEWTPFWKRARKGRRRSKGEETRVAGLYFRLGVNMTENQSTD
jgi:hypothetical protein